MKSPAGTLSDRTVLHSKMEGPRPDKFAFAKRSGTMKAPVGLLSDRTVLRKQDGGAPPRQVRVCEAKRSNEVPSGDFKRRNGLAAGKVEGPRPDKFAFVERSGTMKAPVGLLSDRTVLRKQDGGAPPRQVRVCEAKRSNEVPSGPPWQARASWYHKAKLGLCRSWRERSVADAVSLFEQGFRLAGIPL